MTKEDEVVVAEIRANSAIRHNGDAQVVRFLLRLLDEQATQVAALTSALESAMHGSPASALCDERDKAESECKELRADLDKCRADVRAMLEQVSAWKANAAGLREAVRWVDHYLAMPLKEDIRFAFKELRQRMSYESENGPLTTPLAASPAGSSPVHHAPLSSENQGTAPTSTEQSSVETHTEGPKPGSFPRVGDTVEVRFGKRWSLCEVLGFSTAGAVFQFEVRTANNDRRSLWADGEGTRWRWPASGGGSAQATPYKCAAPHPGPGFADIACGLPLGHQGAHATGDSRAWQWGGGSAQPRECPCCNADDEQPLDGDCFCPEWCEEICARADAYGPPGTLAGDGSAAEYDDKDLCIHHGSFHCTLCVCTLCVPVAHGEVKP